MSTELAIIGQEDTALAPTTTGLGVNFGSKLFQLKPATLGIVQPSSTTEGAIKGKLRISETGDQFDYLTCTLLVMPDEARSYYIGDKSSMNRTPDNLMCFSRDMVKPDLKAKVPQSIACKNCPKQDWGPWREYKEKFGSPDKNLIPPCEPYYYVVLIDTVFQMPLQMFIRSKARQELEAGCLNIARRLQMRKSQTKIEPNVFDIKFKLSTKLITTGSFKSYVPVMSDFEGITDEEREAFGSIYLDYVSKETAQVADAEDTPEQKIDNAAQAVNDAVVEATGVADGEIKI